ncbi:phage tail tape measure protein [Microbacterium sp. 22296]|uniref:phage tail tape measure protein n=1 Tax=Microbacterium sp. 22296 TaxID=3453903 RepID=UPI003F84BE60
MVDRTVKVSLTASYQGFVDGMNKAAKATRDLGAEGEKLAQMREAYDGIAAGATLMGSLLAAGVGVAISKFAEFDAAMSSVQAATHESTSNMGLLRNAAIDAGASTVFSATEAAGAIEELAKAGVSTADIMAGGLAGSLDLAAAGGLGVARAAEVTSTALNQFSLDGNQAGHVADVLAAGAGKAMGSVDDLANGLKFVGPVAASMGVSLEETTGVLALFAQQGIIGEQAGTSLRGVLSSLTAPSGAASKEIERLGLNLYGANGQFLGMQNAAGELSKAYTGMDDASRQASLGVIFGRETITAATALYKAGATGVQEWSDRVNDSGYAAETARMRLDNLKGDLEGLGGAVDSALIQTGSAANDTLRAIVQSLTFLTSGYSELASPVQAATLAIGAGTAAVLLFGGTAVAAVPRVLQWKAAVDASNISLTSVALKAGVAGLAIAGLTTVVGYIISEQARAQAAAEAYADTLDDVSGQVTASTREMAKEALAVEKSWLGFSRGSAYDAAEKLSLDLDTVTDAASGSVDALEALSSVLKAGQGDTQEAARLADELGLSLTEVSSLSTLVSTSVLGEARSLEVAMKMAQQKQQVQEEGIPVTQSAADAYMEAASGVTDLSNSLDQLIDQIMEANGIGQDAITANIDYQNALAGVDEAIQKARDGVDGYALTLDTGTQAGRNNKDMLVELSKQAQDAALAQFKLDGDTANYRATLENSRQALIDRAQQLGYNADQAGALADEIFRIPPSTEWKVIAETQQAMNRAEAFKNLWENIRNRTVTLTMIGSTQIGGGTGPQVGPLLDGYKSENGNMSDYANGLRQIQFENGGGVDTGIYRGTAAAIHKFAEKDTIWESYISGKPSQRDRNIKIWEATGDRLGVQRGAAGMTQVAVTAQFPENLMLRLDDGTTLRAYVQDAAAGVAATVVRNVFAGDQGGLR